MKTLKEQLNKKGIFVSDWAEDILKKVKITKIKKNYTLEEYSVKELGFPTGATYKEICNKAITKGLEVCPASIVMDYDWDSLKKGEWKVIAMNPITDSDGRLGVFSVERYDGGGRYLHASHGNADYVWYSHDRLVFLRRKSELSTKIL